jgi:hypothetical protein
MYLSFINIVPENNGLYQILFFLFKNNNLTDTFSIGVLERIR